ncbi:MAG: hypothetical protein WCI88_08910 [Chloroflexota bacterium]
MSSWVTLHHVSMMLNAFTIKGVASEHRLLFRRGVVNACPPGPEGNQELMGPSLSREVFERKRTELETRKNNVIKRIEQIQQHSGKKQEWEAYKQRFVKDYEYWNTNYERIASGHRQAFQRNLDEVLGRYEYQVAGSVNEKADLLQPKSVQIFQQPYQDIRRQSSQSSSSDAQTQQEQIADQGRMESAKRHARNQWVILPETIGKKGWQYRYDSSSDTLYARSYIFDQRGERWVHYSRYDSANQKWMGMQNSPAFESAANTAVEGPQKLEPPYSAIPLPHQNRSPSIPRVSPTQNQPNRSTQQGVNNSTDALKQQEQNADHQKMESAKRHARNQWVILPEGIGKKGWQYRYDSSSDTLYARTFASDQRGGLGEWINKFDNASNTWISIHTRPVFDDTPIPAQGAPKQPTVRKAIPDVPARPTPSPDVVLPTPRGPSPQPQPDIQRPSVPKKPVLSQPRVTPKPIPKITPTTNPIQRTPEPPKLVVTKTPAQPKAIPKVTPTPKSPTRQITPDPQQPAPEKSELARQEFRKKAEHLKQLTQDYWSPSVHSTPLAVDLEKEHLEKFTSVFGDSDPAYSKETQARLQYLREFKKQWYNALAQHDRMREKLPKIVEGKSFGGVRVKVEDERGHPCIVLRGPSRPNASLGEKYSSMRLDFLLSEKVETITDEEYEKRILGKIRDSCWGAITKSVDEKFRYFFASGYDFVSEIGDKSIVIKTKEGGRTVYTATVAVDGTLPDVSNIQEEVAEKVILLRHEELAKYMPNKVSGLTVHWDGKETVTFRKKWDDGREGPVGQPVLLSNPMCRPTDVVKRLEKTVQSMPPSMFDSAHYTLWNDEPKTVAAHTRYGIGWKYTRKGIQFTRDTSQDRQGYVRPSDPEPFLSIKADDYAALDRLIAQHEKAIGDTIVRWKEEAARHDLRCVLAHEAEVKDGYGAKAVFINKYGFPVVTCAVDITKSAEENNKAVLKSIKDYLDLETEALRSLTALRPSANEKVEQYMLRFLPVYARYYKAAVKTIDKGNPYAEATKDSPPAPYEFAELPDIVRSWKWNGVRGSIEKSDLPSEVKHAFLQLYRVGDPLYDPFRKEVEVFLAESNEQYRGREVVAGEHFALALPKPYLKEGDIIRLELNGKAFELPMIKKQTMNADYIDCDNTPLEKAGFKDIVSVQAAIVSFGGDSDRIFVTSERPMRIAVEVHRSVKEFTCEIPKTIDEYFLRKQSDGSVRVLDKEQNFVAVITDIEKSDMQIWLPEAVNDEAHGKVTKINKFSQLQYLMYGLRDAKERVAKVRVLEQKQQRWLSELEMISTLSLRYLVRSKHSGSDVIPGKNFTLEKKQGAEPSWFIKEGNMVMGQAQLCLNYNKDGYEIELQDTSGKKLEIYTNVDRFRNDAARETLMAYNSKVPIEMREGKRFGMEVGHRIIVHKGIELEISGDGRLGFKFDMDLYEGIPIIGGAAKTNGVSIETTPDQGMMQGNVFTFFKDGKVVAEVAKSIVGNVVRFDVKKDGKPYSVLQLPPKTK